MFDNLLTYETLYECCAESFGFGNAVLKRDFGPWKKGEKVEHLWFNLEESTATSYTTDEKLASCKFQLTAV